MLRVDVVGADAYPGDSLKNFAIPASNPIPTYNAAHPGSPISGFGEVYLTGLRNVYRASFDRANGDLWMGDVGETFAEEVSFLKAGSNAVRAAGRLRLAATRSNLRQQRRRRTAHAAPIRSPTRRRWSRCSSFCTTAAARPSSAATCTTARSQSSRASTSTPTLSPRGIPHNSGCWISTATPPTASFNGNNGTNTDVSSLWQSLVYDPTDPTYLPDSTTGSIAGLDHIVSFGEDNAGNVYLVDFGNGSGFDGQYPGAGRGEIFRIMPTLAVTVTVDRDSGRLLFANETGAAIDIRGYSLASPSGAIDRDELTPVTGRLDAMPSGDGTIDPNNIWQITSTPGSHTLFSESSTGTATSLDLDESFELSPADGWIQSIYEDFDLRVTLGDGSTVQANVDFTGGVAFERSDLNFNDVLDPADWIVFRTYHLTNMAGLSKAESYGLGDLDGDGDNDFSDFRLFQTDYIDANGPAAFARLLSAPEPGSIVLLLTVIAAAACCRSRRQTIWLASAAALWAGLLVTDAEATLVRQYTFNTGTAEDSIGTADGTLNGNATVTFGALDLSGNTGDYVSLPASTIDITSFTDATFEAWFTFRGGGPWQRVFDFGRTVSGSGRDYIFYTPNSGDGDNRAGFRDSNLAENTAFAGPTVSQNSTHHVAVVVDDNANGGTNRMTVYLDGAFGGDVALSYSFSDFSTTNRLAYLGRSLFNVDAYLNGTIDEFRIHNNALTAQQVQDSFATGPVPSDLLRLEVNTVTGAVSVKNQLSTPLTFDYYRVASETGTLAPSTWNSLDDQNVGAIGGGEGESWDEIGSPDANEVAELFLLGGSTLAPSASLDLGKLYDPSVIGTRQNGDLVFQYALQGEDLRQGLITYVIPPPLPGDYNDNGVVDVADYTVWRDHLNTAFQLPNEVAGVSNGSVTAADYDAWKARFGDSLAGSGAGGGAFSVPESTCVSLFACALLGPICVSRRSRRG